MLYLFTILSMYMVLFGTAIETKTKFCVNCKHFIPNDIFKLKYNHINITSDISGKIIENINNITLLADS